MRSHWLKPLRQGSSVIMYHSPELRRYQYYVNSSWIGVCFVHARIRCECRMEFDKTHDFRWCLWIAVNCWIKVSSLSVVSRVTLG